MSFKIAHNMQACDPGQRIPYFDSCQLTLTWMSNIKLNIDCKYRGPQASECGISRHPLT